MARLPRIPDLLTTANLCCGTGSILLASQGQLTWACWLVFAGAAFDVLDGLAARALGGGSELGKQLDSLADMVTFGVAPAFLLFFLIGTEEQMHGVRRAYQFERFPAFAPTLPLWPMLLVIPVASAWRLAKFNLDSRQTTGFVGLPTPANALFWASLPLIISGQTIPHTTFAGHTSNLFIDTVIRSADMLLVLSFGLSALMLSPLPLPSLKFKHYKWRGNEVIYLLLGIGAVLVLLYGVLAVPLLLVLYLFNPLWGRLFPK